MTANFAFVLFFLVQVIFMFFVHFREYRDNKRNQRFMSATKLNLIFTMSLTWFFHYVYIIVNDKANLIAHLIGAAGSLIFAAFLIFECSPKMSKACLLFFAKRYGFICCLCILSIYLPFAYIGIIMIGCSEVYYEIHQMKKVTN